MIVCVLCSDVLSLYNMYFWMRLFSLLRMAATRIYMVPFLFLLIDSVYVIGRVVAHLQNNIAALCVRKAVLSTIIFMQFSIANSFLQLI